MVSSDESVKSNEPVGDADACARAKRIKEAENEINRALFEQDTEVLKPYEDNFHGSDYNLDQGLESKVFEN